MSQSDLKSVRNYLSDALFEKLSQRLDWTMRLERAWAKRVPPPLALYTRPLSYRAGCLLVVTAASLWASRLRQQRVRLITALRKDSLFSDLLELRVRVTPGVQSADTETGKDVIAPPLGLSSTNAELLRVLADDIEDPDLKAALRRLGAVTEDASAG